MRIEAIKREKITTDLEIVGATLLSVEEAKLLPENLRRDSHDWWLRSPGCYSDFADYVYADGSVYCGGGSVRSSSGAVRPALIIRNFKSSNLKIGDVILFDDREFEIISNMLAFCKTDIGYQCFNSNDKREDANIYETSEIKKFVDHWFKKTKEREIEKELL